MYTEMNVAGEIFPKAPLVQVIYEIRFPTLFYIPQIIGEFQIKITDDFPKASQLSEVQFALEDGVPKFPASEAEKMIPSWQFESETGKTTVLVKKDRLAISSQEYNSYDHPSGKKFRDVINKIVTEFLDKVPIKKFSRVGLRYIDNCPLIERTNQYFTKYYEPVLDFEKYELADILESHIVIRKKKDMLGIVFQSKITQVDNEYKYIMDFDAYAENVESANFLSVTDELRTLDRTEFFSNIKDDFLQYMRGF